MHKRDDCSILLCIRRVLAQACVAAVITSAQAETSNKSLFSATLDKLHLPAPSYQAILSQMTTTPLVLPEPSFTPSEETAPTTVKNETNAFGESLLFLYDTFKRMDFLDALLPEQEIPVSSPLKKKEGAAKDSGMQDKNLIPPTETHKGVSTPPQGRSYIPELPWGQLIDTSRQTQRMEADIEKVCPITMDRRHLGLLPELLQFMGPVPVDRSHLKKPRTAAMKDAAERGDFFFIPKGPPPGFEFLNEPQTTLVDVYSEGKRIGEVEATFSPEFIEITHPALIVERLKGVKDKEGFINALTGKLSLNTSLICPKKRRIPVCNPPSVESGAAVVFDLNNYRVDVFANADLMEAGSRPDPFLPPPTAGKSFDNGLNLILSGSTPGNTNSYNFNTNGFLANGGARLNYRTSLAGDITTEGSSSSDDSDDSGSSNLHQFNITELNASIDRGRFNAQAGYINTIGGLFISNQDLLGIGMGLTLNTLRRESRDAFGSPLLVFLDSPSQVSVFKNGRLMTSEQLPAGQQFIDTTALPSGSYEVEIRVQNALGNFREEKQFFVKSTEFPPLGYPVYYANAGFLTNTTTSANTILPETSSTLLYQAGLNKRIGENWGVRGGLIGTPDNHYLDVGMFFLLPWYNMQIEPQVLLGQNNDYGVSMIGRAEIGPLYMSLFATLFSADDLNENDTEINENEVVFDPFSEGNSRVNFSMSFPINIASTSVTLNTQWSKNEGDDDPTYNYGFRTRSILKRFPKSTLELDLAASRSDTDPLLAIGGLLWRYTGEKFQHTVAAGYEHSEEEGIETGPTAAFETIWRNYDAAQEGLRITVAGDTLVDQQGIGFEIDELNRLIHGNIQTRHNRPTGDEGEANTQYNGFISSRFVWAEGGAPAFGAGRGGQSGVMAYIESDEPGQEFQVLNQDQQVLRVIKTNQRTPIFLNNFDEYNISIKAVGTDFFKYDERKEQVVLYPGNYQFMKWEAKQKIIVFTQVLLPDQTPLDTARAVETADFNFTDPFGFIQLEIFKGQREVEFDQVGRNLRCMVTLPEQMDVQNSFASVDTSICVPIAGVVPPRKPEEVEVSEEKVELPLPPLPKPAATSTPQKVAPPRDEAKLPTPRLTPELEVPGDIGQ